MAIGFFAVLLSVILMLIFPSVIWARVDAKQLRFDPLPRGLAVAGIYVAVVIAFTLFQLLLERSRVRGAFYEINVAWGSMFLSLGLMFLIACSFAWISYAIGYVFAEKGSAEAADGDVEPKIRVDETGNPYQPPST